MKCKMIIATSDSDSNYAIGKDNKLLTHIPEDLVYFKRVTEGATVIMGNNTFKSLPNMPEGLPNRRNIVISSKPIESEPRSNLLYLSHLNNPLGLIVSSSLFTKDTFVIGGASIYKQMLPFVNEIHHTVIEGSFPDSDTHLDMSFLSEGEWTLYSKEKLCDKACVYVWRRV